MDRFHNTSADIIHALVRRADNACWECLRIFATAPALLDHLLTDHWEVRKRAE